MKINSDLYFSIIIPVYNTPIEYLEECIGSVLKQTFDSYEIIICNDGSNNEVYNWCENVKEKSEKISVIHQKNSGVSKARNNALDSANGKYIFFLDSDDWIKPDCLEKIYNEGDCDYIFFNYYMMYGKGRNVNCSLINVEKNNISKNELLKIALYNKERVRNKKANFVEMCTPWAKVFNRKIIEKNSLRFDEKMKLGEDLLFLINYLDKIDDFKFINESLYINRCHENSCVNSYFDDGIYRAEILLNNLKKFTEKKDFLIEYYYLQGVTVLLGLLAHYFIKYDVKKMSDYLEQSDIFKEVINNVNVNFLSFRRKLIIDMMRKKKYKRLLFMVKMKESF